MNELFWKVPESFTHWSGTLVGWLENWALLGLCPKASTHGTSGIAPSGSLDFYVVAHGFKTKKLHGLLLAMEPLGRMVMCSQ